MATNDVCNECGSSERPITECSDCGDNVCSPECLTDHQRVMRHGTPDGGEYPHITSAIEEHGVAGLLGRGAR